MNYGDIFNVLGSSLNAIIAITLVIALQNRNDKCPLGSRVFLLFWACTSVINIIMNPLTAAGLNPWGLLLVVMIGQLFLLLAVYSLHLYDKFTWGDRGLITIVGVTAILWIVVLVEGLCVRSNDIQWRLFMASPAIMLSIAGYSGLAVVAGSRYPNFRVAIYIVLSVYCLVQIPVFHAALSELDWSVLKLFLGLLKILFAGIIICIAANVVWKADTHQTLRLAKIVVTVLSAIIGVALLVVRGMHFG